MRTEVTDNPGRSRYEIRADGELAGFAEYRGKPGLIAFIHTEVDDRFEGHGLGSELIRAALDRAREKGDSVLPFCPFVLAFIEKHREYAGLVPSEQRASFGL